MDLKQEVEKLKKQVDFLEELKKNKKPYDKDAAYMISFLYELYSKCYEVRQDIIGDFTNSNYYECDRYIKLEGVYVDKKRMQKYNVDYIFGVGTYVKVHGILIKPEIMFNYIIPEKKKKKKSRLDLLDLDKLGLPKNTKVETFKRINSDGIGFALLSGYNAWIDKMIYSYNHYNYLLLDKEN